MKTCGTRHVDERKKTRSQRFAPAFILQNSSVHGYVFLCDGGVSGKNEKRVNSAIRRFPVAFIIFEQ